ncbi:MAG: hypothetical protein ACYC2P_12315 [Paludibacteraceae bacterium]
MPETEEKNTGRFINGLRDNDDSYTPDEILEEYRYLNEDFVTVIECFESIFNKMQVSSDEISLLNSTEYYYVKRKIIREGSRQYEEYIFKNILETAFQGTINKAKSFFGQSVDDWDSRADRYRSYAVKISDKYYDILIGHIDSLLFDLKELYCDYYDGYSELNDFFSFSDVMENIQGLDLEEQRQSVIRTMAECKEFCLKDDYNTVKKEQVDEFLDKCRKLVELIDFQAENGISINPTYAEIEEWQKDPVERNIAQNHTQEQNNKPIPETDITLKRQFLALYYMLNELDNKMFSRNKAEIARFIQMLTGKNFDNIYKLTKNPLKDPLESTSAKYQSDIQFVKESFLKLGLDNIARKIENDNLIR